MIASASANIAEVRSAQAAVTSTRGAASLAATLFAVDVEHRISFAESKPRMEQKVVRFIDSTHALNAIGFLL
jgi:hypothetical protein